MLSKQRNHTSLSSKVLGIDIGGTGIKGAIVNIDKGILVSERYRLDTPRPATPGNILYTVNSVVNHFKEDKYFNKNCVGLAFPAVIHNNVAKTATNISKYWIDVNVVDFFSKNLDTTINVINDADAAGISELKFGNAKDIRGTVLLITLGTGIGSALIHNGVLIPNTELGHIEVDGRVAEKTASGKVRLRNRLTWEQYSRKLQKYFNMLESIMTLDLIIIGGGISKEHRKFLPLLKTKTPIVAAKLRNNAGIIGSAIEANNYYKTHNSLTVISQ